MSPGAGDRLTAAVGALLEANGAAGGPIGVAASGGSDSTALVVAAADWARERGTDLRVATVDHGLRLEAASEAAQVAALCARLGLRHDVLTLADLRLGPNLQERAREARYAALAAWGAGTGRTCVLLGHTADDVAETLLLRLGRGAGIDGLARMAAWRGDRPAWGRPFLGMRREALRDRLREEGIAWSEDASNDDPAFARVRARRAIAALGLDPLTLAGTAAALDDARATLHARTRAIADVLVREDRGDLVIEARPLAALLGEEPEHPRRLLVAALAWVGGARPPRRAAQLRLLDHLRDRAPLTLGGCLLSFAGDSLRIGREPAAVGPPGPTDAVWDGRWRVEGPHEPGLAVGALGADASRVDWRATGLPRATILASPAIRRGACLVAAPIAGWPEGWRAAPRVPFAQALAER